MDKKKSGQYSGRKRLQFCAQRDPLGKRITFAKKSTTSIKNEATFIYGRDQKFSTFFNLKIFHSKMYEIEKF